MNGGTRTYSIQGIVASRVTITFPTHKKDLPDTPIGVYQNSAKNAAGAIQYNVY
jgi:hypothetical protein